MTASGCYDLWEAAFASLSAEAQQDLVGQVEARYPLLADRPATSSFVLAACVRLLAERAEPADDEPPAVIPFRRL